MNETMSITRPTIRSWHSDTELRATQDFTLRRAHSPTAVQYVRKAPDVPSKVIPIVLTTSPLSKRTNWNDREYREAYMEAAIEQGVAWQIRINRLKRGLSQADLARAIGTQQSAVSRQEDPEYGRHNLDTLVQIAKVFDCALLVKFVSYSMLASDSDSLSENDQYAVPFSQEIGVANG